jgi:hypothetical protein
MSTENETSRDDVSRRVLWPSDYSTTAVEAQHREALTAGLAKLREQLDATQGRIAYLTSPDWCRLPAHAAVRSLTSRCEWLETQIAGVLEMLSFHEATEDTETTYTSDDLEAIEDTCDLEGITERMTVRYQLTPSERVWLDWIGERYATSAYLLTVVDGENVATIDVTEIGRALREDDTDRAPCLAEDTQLGRLIWFIGPDEEDTCDHCGEEHPIVTHDSDCEWHNGTLGGECICGDNVMSRASGGYLSVDVDCIDEATS